MNARMIAGCCLAGTFLFGWQAYEAAAEQLPSGTVEMGGLAVAVALVFTLTGLCALCAIPRDDRCTTVRRLERDKRQLEDTLYERDRVIATYEAMLTPADDEVTP